MIVVVRHGRTAWNAEGRFQGWADVPLDPEGRRQSVAVADALSGALTWPRQVVSSDLRRAVDTAGAVAGALGVVATAERDLREVDVGAWEGLTPAQVEARFPEEVRRWSAGEDLRRGAGETVGEAGYRVALCIERLLAATEQTLVVVGHGVSLQAALALLGERGLVQLDGPPPHLDNGQHLILAETRQKARQP